MKNNPLRVSRNECVADARALFTATRRRAESELWRKDCSITTATSEVCVQHLTDGIEKGTASGELPYRAYMRDLEDVFRFISHK